MRQIILDGKTINVCGFNNGVECNSDACDNCGWNPQVEAKRIKQMKTENEVKFWFETEGKNYDL